MWGLRRTADAFLTVPDGRPQKTPCFSRCLTHKPSEEFLEPGVQVGKDHGLRLEEKGASTLNLTRGSSSQKGQGPERHRAKPAEDPLSTPQDRGCQRISAVLDVLCDIPDALLHPHLVLVKFLLPLLQLLDLCLELNQLVGNLPGIATRPHTPEPEE